MNKIIFTNEPIVNSSALYIVHQCSCKGKNALYTSKLIFDKFPYANCYPNDRIPGTITKIDWDYDKQKGIVNLYAQLYPGPPSENDTSKMRLDWFKECMNKLKDSLQYQYPCSFSFPYKIGCGSAKGDWEQYFEIIKEFSLKTESVIFIHKSS